MSSIAKAAVLSLTLVAGFAAVAYAQSSNIASLPPDTAPPATTVISPVAPSAAYPGPDPGRGWYAQEQQTQAVAPSGTYPGPDPGRGWYAQERPAEAVAPSTRYPGPKLN